MLAPSSPPRVPPLVLLALASCALLGVAATVEPAASDLSAPVGIEADHVVGTLLPSGPDALDLEDTPAPSIARIRALLEAGDAPRAQFVAERFVAAAEPGRARDAAWLALGSLHAEAGRHNLACEAFAEVRAGSGPLAPLATRAEAEEEAARGQPQRAVERCREYQRRWPDGAQEDDCLRILARAYADLDQVDAARAAAAAYDDDHPLGKIGEQVDLALATRLADEDPPRAIPLLVSLAVTHSAALTGRVAEEELARLRAAGTAAAVLPTDPESLRQRALSLRDSGRREAAWAAFEALADRDDPPTRAFVEEEAERFAWQAQRWDFLVELYREERVQTGDDGASWSQYKALVRGGRFSEAGDLALEMVKDGRGHWRRAEDEVGRTLMLARRYPEARAQFDVVAARGGWSGRRAELSAAFAAYMAGELDDAVSRSTVILDEADGDVVEARYWRARALEKLGRADEARADREWILANEGWSWYAALVRSATDPAPLARSGRWVGERPIVLPTPIVSLAPGDAVPPRPVPLARVDASAAFARWQPGAAPISSAPVAAPPAPLAEGEPPASYRASALYDPDGARATLATFATAHARRWPELLAISDLASVGLYDWSGPLMNEWYEDWRALVRRRDREAKKLNSLDPQTWQALFLASRDHHDAARTMWGQWEDQTDPALLTEARRLAYPLAHDRYVWSHARERDIDPFLVLGLMRQESTYDANARSRVGARGAMQIMPRTGHLLADLAHDTAFDAGDLEDPTVAIGYAMRYLELLMARFDGVYPLAVASYNAGPFNVSNWMRGTGLDMPLDEIVEHIPYRETRDYVKKVTEGYAAYIALYGPPGAQIVLPRVPAADRREIVDF